MVGSLDKLKINKVHIYLPLAAATTTVMLVKSEHNEFSPEKTTATTTTQDRRKLTARFFGFFLVPSERQNLDGKKERTA